MGINLPVSLWECPLFQGMPQEELPVMIQCLRPKVNHYQAQACIAMAGDPFDGVGIVLSGQISLSKENLAGDRVLLAVIGEGEIFGEMAAFSGGNIWPATAEAQTDSDVMFLPPDVIVGNCQRQCGSHRQLITNMLGIVSRKALMLNKKVEYLTMKSMREKIGAYLIEMCQRTGSSMFVLPMNRDDLADFLHVTRPSLSREMGRMRDEGIIEYHRSSIKIKDLEALRRITA